MQGQTAFWIVAMLVLLALAFDFMNGFHDAANSIATVVSTGVLRPGQAVLFAAFFNAIAIFVFGFAVAATMGKGLVNPAIVTATRPPKSGERLATCEEGLSRRTREQGSMYHICPPKCQIQFIGGQHAENRQIR